MNTLAKPPSTPRGASAITPQDSTIIAEINTLTGELAVAMKASVGLALRIGLRLIVLHREVGPANFTDALDSITPRVPRATAYRWVNAASLVIAKHQDICDHDGTYEPEELDIPASGSAEWKALEAALTTYAQGTSLRRLLLGSAATSDESRQDTLISAAEAGDPHAEAMLDKVAAGQLTLVQAIRAQAGAAATKDKQRTDPIYLDLDGATGQPRGLFPRCLITLSNTFDHWEEFDESARNQARSAWKALVAKLPKELR